MAFDRLTFCGGAEQKQNDRGTGKSDKHVLFSLAGFDALCSIALAAFTRRFHPNTLGNVTQPKELNRQYARKYEGAGKANSVLCIH
jgi:hypothetical protein